MGYTQESNYWDWECCQCSKRNIRSGSEIRLLWKVLAWTGCVLYEQEKTPRSTSCETFEAIS